MRLAVMSMAATSVKKLVVLLGAGVSKESGIDTFRDKDGLWSKKDATQIHVRTWQPDKFGGKAIPKDEIFSLSDFDI